MGLVGARSGAEHQLVALVQQAVWRAGPERRQQRRGQERRPLQALSDVAPQRALYLRRLAHAHDDQLAVLQAHQDVALLLGDGDAAHRHPHGHGLAAQRQAAGGGGRERERERESCEAHAVAGGGRRGGGLFFGVHLERRLALEAGVDQQVTLPGHGQVEDGERQGAVAWRPQAAHGHRQRHGLELWRSSGGGVYILPRSRRFCAATDWLLAAAGSSSGSSRTSSSRSLTFTCLAASSSSDSAFTRF
ncbi:hypothetical protein EYF80_034113 [Liparis tanakae]|uniref:Uncharacterized protein n=1 Tax=Liparis tanakae TaxID=230148 RepID=A0A4Z2GPS5_9TELE|nr:hypothetical protein EYF80_034113 [Liparis tanakae]